MSNKPFAVGGMNVVSPKGKAKWCKYVQPDREYDTDGKYETLLILDPSDPATQAFVNRLEKLQDQAFEETLETLGARGKGVTKRHLYTEDDQGNYVFKFSLKGIDKRKAEGKPHEIVVVDAQKNPIVDKPLVGHGSTIRVASFVYPYYMATNRQVGLSMMWSKMQIIDLIEYKPNGGGDDFDEEEGFAVTATVADDDF